MSDWWKPVLADARYAEHLRNDYAHDAHMSDDELLEKYCSSRKYVLTWDTLGDAYEEHARLADAYLELQQAFTNRGEHADVLVAKITELEGQLGIRNQRVHFRPNNKEITACGVTDLDGDEAAYDARDVNCPDCKLTKPYCIMMGIRR